VTVGGPSAASSIGGSSCWVRLGGASDTACATPSNTVLQWPQRTWPLRNASCSGFTRNTVAQPGQRVYFSSGIGRGVVGIGTAAGHGRCATPSPIQRERARLRRVPASVIQPSSLSQTPILNHRRYD